MNPIKQRLITIIRTKLAASSNQMDIDTSNLADDDLVKALFKNPTQFYRKTGYRLTYSGKEILRPHFESWSIKLAEDVNSTLLLVQLDRLFKFPWYLGGVTQINPHTFVDPFIIVFDADVAMRLKLYDGDLKHFVKVSRKP